MRVGCVFEDTVALVPPRFCLFGVCRPGCFSCITERFLVSFLVVSAEGHAGVVFGSQIFSWMTKMRHHVFVSVIVRGEILGVGAWPFSDGGGHCLVNSFGGRGVGLPSIVLCVERRLLE